MGTGLSHWQKRFTLAEAFHIGRSVWIAYVFAHDPQDTNTHCAKRRNHVVNDRAAHPTLREWRDHMMSPTRMAAFAGVAVILALAGPFETSDVMRAAPRLAYWAVVVVCSYSIGYWINIWAANIWVDRGLGADGTMIKRLIFSALVTSAGVVALIYILNGVAIGFWPTGKSLFSVAANIVVVSSIVTGVFHVAGAQDAARTVQTDTRPHIALLDRLPLEKRAALVSISVEDHYVRIRTTQAEDMILLRLADAIRETAETGLQVHRSHWVAIDQVTTANRKGDRAVLTMTTGPDIPVSRANIAKIKEAGLLPR